MNGNARLPPPVREREKEKEDSGIDNRSLGQSGIYGTSLKGGIWAVGGGGKGKKWGEEGVSELE